MLFNSYIFIFAFLPICLLGYYLLRGRNANLTKCWLVICSLTFYGYFNIAYLAIMICSVLGNYALYKLMKNRNKKLLLIFGVTANLAVLFYYKYFDFFITNVNAIANTDINLRNILLPLGISFFTFQQISFLHDVYKGDMREVGFVDYSLFVTFFPQLIAGPIVTGDEMLPQFVRLPEFDSDRFASGIATFTFGLAKKVLIADTFAKAVDYGYANIAGISGTEAFLTMLFYTIQLYFDFSGYCDMAIGIGRMFGIDIAQNFNSPYKAVNIDDFWKRWHITLSRFFTKNVYIPLGGNRRGALRTYINLFLIFFLSGLWHGAGWNFVVWGCLHGALYVVTRAYHNRGYKLKDNAANKFISVLLTFAFVNVAWIFFRAPGIAEACTLINRIFTGDWSIPSESFVEGFNLWEFWYVLKVLKLTAFKYSKYILAVAISIFTLGITFFAPNIHETVKKMKFNGISAIIVAVLLAWCIVSLSGVSTFLYFNF